MIVGDKSGVLLNIGYWLSFRASVLSFLFVDHFHIGRLLVRIPEVEDLIHLRPPRNLVRDEQHRRLALEPVAAGISRAVVPIGRARRSAAPGVAASGLNRAFRGAGYRENLLSFIELT